jgi:hypothetical protein
LAAGKYDTPRAFDIALHARLRKIAQRHGMDLVRARREIAYDRFLARLQAAAPGEWLLKGGVALDLRFPPGAARRTGDVDLETTSARNLDGARDLIVKAAAADLEDFFTFNVSREPTGAIQEGVPAYRFTLEASMNGRVFESFTCDVGIADQNIGMPERVKGRSLLDFAGIESPEVLAVPLNRHIAEKLHAYVQTHNGGPSSRAKDLVDLALLTSFRDVAAARELREALDHVFAGRATQLPQRLPEPPALWKQSYPVLANGIAVPQTAEEAHALAAALLDPVLAGGVDAGHSWNAARQRWEDPNARDRAAQRAHEQGRERALER